MPVNVVVLVRLPAGGPPASMPEWLPPTG